MQISQPNIEARRINELTPWDKNPRNIDEKGYERLKKKIVKKGLYKPLIINEQNVIIGGNQRFKILQELGVAEVIVCVVKAPDEKTMLEYALDDNDHAGTTDQAQLAQLIMPYRDQIDLNDYRFQSNTGHDLNAALNKYDNPPEDKKADDGSQAKSLILYFDAGEFDQVTNDLDSIGGDFGKDNASEAVLALIEHYKQHKQK